MRGIIALAAALLAGTAAAQNAAPEVKTYGDWKRLRAHAHTADEFRKLSVWCSSQAGLYRRKAEGYEAKLKDYYANPSFRAEPKYPSAGQQLKTLIAHYRELAQHWEDLEAAMNGKAEQIEAAAGSV
ncbi:MAG TPA: hypothetical protein VKB88_35555 [Bryobacteraceae bacterium]|nr:hypothetical protein [Bryobacteraceae bacterium]